MVEHLTIENFEEEIGKTDSLVVLDFYADWCGPCRMMAPIFEELAGEVKDAKFLKVDTEWFELYVVKWGKRILEKTRIVQLEFTQLNAYNGILLKDIIDLFPGFVMYRLLPNGLLPLWKYDPLTWEIFGFQNIILINKSFS